MLCNIIPEKNYDNSNFNPEIKPFSFEIVYFLLRRNSFLLKLWPNQTKLYYTKLNLNQTKPYHKLIPYKKDL